MGMTKFELFALVVFGMAVLGFAAWRQIKRIGLEAEARNKLQKGNDAANLSAHTREELSILGLIGADRSQGEIDEAWRRKKIHEVDSYNEAASMEPFSDEGRKKRERKKESRTAEWESHSPLFFEVVADSEPSPPSSHGYYSGHGGSFDGGGASDDWGRSSSSSSSNSDCSSSSSDSGGSCGGSSD